MWAIIKNTFREALAKKIFIGYYIFYAIVILFMYFAASTDSIQGVMSMTDVKQSVMLVENGFITLAFPLILFFSLISTSSFIPSMLDKGTIDLIISKPVSRFTILFSKFFGAVIFVFASMVFLFGSIWLILSAKSGYWDPTFLVAILNVTIAFAVMYSIVVLISLLTQSTIVSILVNFFLIFVLCPILSAREMIIFPLIKSDTVQFVFNFFYYIFPKPGEIKDITVNLISEQSINFWKSTTDNMLVTPSWMSMISSALFCLVVFSYSVYYFSKKDY